jgi:hypothetical protein
MAKKTKSAIGAGQHVGKISFGKRRPGKHAKTHGPKDKQVKAYRGQGR